MSTTPLFDVLIIGAGPAGLATATGLARQLYHAVVFSNDSFRNASSEHMHNFPGWDHQPPSAFRDKTKNDLLARYKTIEFENADIASVEKISQGGFQVTDAQRRSWQSRALVLAQGSEDQFPNISGYEECWGKGIFHCLFCHGYEDRGLPSSGVLCVGPHGGSPPLALHLSRMARRLTEKVTLYTNANAELAAELKRLLETDRDARDGRVSVDDRKIVGLSRGGDEAGAGLITIAFEGGQTITEGFLTHQPSTKTRGPFAEQLGLELQPSGDIMVRQPFNETSVPGVFAAGDCATPIKAVSHAVAMGTIAAAGLAFKLGAELARLE
ncbi:thioredoxin reductase [Pyricularia oryzae]|uniref:Thioredoxin reductase n=2 Tax=Pyricularia oryzae TaxID=318829 RepID=A0AA97PRZ6_PYRO3|nr:thioredoxin reductase [Pyricularia oryzae Y34]KAI7923524.1 thioredoxin reductase [Pyricularia oryzae]